MGKPNNDESKEKNNGKMKNLVVRTLSGVVLLGVVLGAVLWSEYSFGALLLVILIGSMYEFYKIAKLAGMKPLSLYGMILGIAIYLLVFLAATGSIYNTNYLMMVPLLMIVLIAELYRKAENPIANIGATLTGLLYIALPLSMLVNIGIGHGNDYRPWVILCIIFTVWANDIGAYLVGIAIGKHRLFERISPKKSWEGFFGGVICAIAFAALAGHLLGGNVVLWGGLGLVIAISGVFGDLVESLFKRSVGIKDSGRMMPGHGGFLDRFDALIFSVPFVYAYFTIFTL